MNKSRGLSIEKEMEGDIVIARGVGGGKVK